MFPTWDWDWDRNWGGVYISTSHTHIPVKRETGIDTGPGKSAHLAGMSSDRLGIKSDARLGGACAECGGAGRARGAREGAGVRGPRERGSEDAETLQNPVNACHGNVSTVTHRNLSSRVRLQVQVKLSNSDQTSETLYVRLNAPTGKPNVLGCVP